MYENSLNAKISHKDTKAAPLYPATLKKLKYLVSILFILPLFFFLTGKVSANLTDTFTAPDGTDIHTYNPIYTVQGNPVTIQNNAVAPSGSEVTISGNNFVDGCMSMDWTGNSTNTSMAVRDIGNNDSTFYAFSEVNNNGNWQLAKRTDTTHILASGNMDFSGTHNYKLCAVGSTISVSKDGTQFIGATDN